MYFSTYLHTYTNIHKILQVKHSLEFQTCIEASGEAFLEDQDFMLIDYIYLIQMSKKPKWRHRNQYQECKCQEHWEKLKSVVEQGLI